MSHIKYIPNTTDWEMLNMIARGHPDKMIASRMGLSMHSVESRQRWLKKHFQATNRAQLVFNAAIKCRKMFQTDYLI